jgi:predicted nucleotidyltransferase
MVSSPQPLSDPVPKTAIPLPFEPIREFCAKWQVICFELFGSVLRDDFGDESDVDVMVTFDPNARPTLITLGSMEMELEHIFGRKVDLLTRHGVESMENAYRRPHILRSARVIHAR